MQRVYELTIRLTVYNPIHNRTSKELLDTNITSKNKLFWRVVLGCTIGRFGKMLWNFLCLFSDVL